MPASSLQALLFPAKPYPTGCKLVPLNPWGSHCNRSGKKKEEEKKKRRRKDMVAQRKRCHPRAALHLLRVV